MKSSSMSDILTGERESYPQCSARNAFCRHARSSDSVRVLPNLAERLCGIRGGFFRIVRDSWFRVWQSADRTCTVSVHSRIVYLLQKKQRLKTAQWPQFHRESRCSSVEMKGKLRLFGKLRAALRITSTAYEWNQFIAYLVLCFFL